MTNRKPYENSLFIAFLTFNDLYILPPNFLLLYIIYVIFVIPPALNFQYQISTPVRTPLCIEIIVKKKKKKRKFIPLHSRDNIRYFLYYSAGRSRSVISFRKKKKHFFFFLFSFRRYEIGIFGITSINLMKIK